MKITIKQIIFFSTSIILLLLIFSSCSKKKEGLLVGSWEYVWVKQNESSEILVYNFTDGGNIERISTINGIETKNNGTYELEKKSGKLFAKINIIGVPVWMNGKYRVLHVDKDILIMQQVFDTDGNYAFSRFEFVRRN